MPSPDVINAKLLGVEQLNRTLQTFGAAVHEKVAVAAVRRGAGFIERAAKWNAAAIADKGRLARAIVVRVSRGAKYGVRAEIGTKGGRGGASHGHLLEFGTARHRILFRKPHPRAWTHPGSRPKPWLRPAYDTGRPMAEAEVRKSLERGIARLAKQQAARAKR